jgi:DNA-binding GntR family transcriptional regulator
VTTLAPLEVERRTTAERVAAALRTELLAGVFAPGTPMRDQGLAERAGVARSTVREALTLLAGEGLLTHTVNRGMEVRRITATDLADIYAAREVIESAGLARITSRRERALAPLQAAHERLAEGARRGSPAAVADADIAFHLHLAEAAGSALLLEAERRALTEVRLLFAVTDRAYDGGEDQVAQHRVLLDVIREGTPAAAATALRSHLRAAAALLTEVVGEGS